MGIRRRALLATAVALVTVPFAGAMAAYAATAAPAAPAAHTAVAHAATTSASGATVITTEHTKFGTVLVTGTGESLYTFTGDEFPFAATGLQLDCTALNKAASGTPCTTAWPPLTASSVIAEHGVRQGALGTVTRNGVTQVTYFGKPLYGFIADKAANDVNGEDVSAFDGNWYLDRTDGLPAVQTPTVSTEISPNGIVLSSATASGTRSLYLLTSDTPKTSACGTAGGCVALWPPLLTTHRAIAGTGAGRHLIGTILRSDGTFQVTYAGHPLYFFALDLAAGATGETNGEHLLDPAPVDGIWYTLLPNGNPNAGTANIQSCQQRHQRPGRRRRSQRRCRHPVRVQRRHPGAEQLHRDVRRVLAAGPHPERTHRVGGGQRLAARRYPARRRDLPGDVRRPPAVLLLPRPGQRHRRCRRDRVRRHLQHGQRVRNGRLTGPLGTSLRPSDGARAGCVSTFPRKRQTQCVGVQQHGQAGRSDAGHANRAIRRCPFLVHAFVVSTTKRSEGTGLRLHCVHVCSISPGEA